MNLRRLLAGAPVLLVACAGGAADDQREDRLETIGSVAQESFTYVQFGTRCQQEYQNNWYTPFSGAWTRCSGFVNAVASQNGRGNFYYDLHGAQAAFYGPDTCGWSCGYIDSVDFFYTETHGCKNDTDACWFMWDDNDRTRRAFSGRMRLGASGRQNMVFSTFSCDTLLQDSHMWDRWDGVFAGGLVMTTGSNPTVWLDSASDTASDYFYLAANNVSISESWHSALLYGDSDNKPSVMNTGSNSTNCWSRQSSVTLSNLLGTPVLRDGAVGYTCWTGWN